MKEHEENFNRRVSEAKVILLEKFEYFKDVLKTEIITSVDFNESVSEEDRVPEAYPTSWSAKRDLFIIDVDWVNKHSSKEFAYAYGFVAWAKYYDIKHEDGSPIIEQLAANLRYSIDFNGHNAFFESEKWYKVNVVSENRNFHNEIRNFIEFENVAPMSWREIYDCLMTKKDEIYETYGYEDEPEEEIRYV